jgi:biotin carboxyl carrier protein
MKLHATVGEEEYDVELRREGERVFAVIGDRSYELDVQESGRTNYLLRANARVFDCRVAGRATSGMPVEVLVGTDDYWITLTDPKRLRGATSAGAHADGAIRIIAPMPGRVVRVMATVGDEIEAGAGIVVVEAMKMQNEMKALKAGTIVALNVQVGATVSGGDVLAIIE